MNGVQLSVTSIWAALFLAACSGESSNGPGTAGQGGASVGGGAQTGGTAATATTDATTTAATSGGSASTGGQAGTGGIANTGGKASSSTGGKASTGGNPSTATGGKASTGGNSSAPTGGTANTGGSASSEPIVITSAQNAYWKTATATTSSSSSADLTVNSTGTQEWEGFGGCFNEKGWGVLTSSALQSQAIDLLFGANGAHFVLGRIPIGASDYADDRYTLDDTSSPVDPQPDGTESNRPPADNSMSKFSIERDTKKLIPYIQAALAVNPSIRLWASPWTPPSWMKTGYKKDSGASSGGNAKRPSYFDGGSMKSDATTRGALAQYFVKWIQAYGEKGINVEAVAPQNEPNFDQNYPSCKWDKATYTNFVKDLASAISAAGLSTKIMLGTMSNSTGDPDIVSAVMADSTAKGKVTSIGLQWGMVDKAPQYKSYGLPMWVSEHKCGNYPWESGYKASAPNDFAYAQESWGLIRDAIKGGVTAYNAWNMVLDPVGKGNDTSRDWAQNALLTVSGGTITQTPTYYVFRHLSQYVAAGATVVGTSGSTDALAFKNPDGSFVAVVYSNSAKSNYVVSIAGKKLQFSMPAGWATIVAK
jgi:glucosylceramidase